MKNIIQPVLAYLIVCIIVISIPDYPGYNFLGWKLFVGQIYAIPLLIVTAIVTILINKKRI
ncbi:DUF4017 family protein [Bacillus sp. F19]|nr:DUF4017 family protein [Bacillus sp. F19]